MASEENTTPLFSPEKIPAAVISALPSGYSMRPLRKSDFSAGFLDVLRVLTKVGDIGREDWEERYDWMAERNNEYFVICVCDDTAKIVAVGTLILEKKFLRGLGTVGHVEDIAVAKDQQGKKLGLHIIHALDHIAKEMGCYKAILDCSQLNVGFYEKCGYKQTAIQMSHYYDS